METRKTRSSRRRLASAAAGLVLLATTDAAKYAKVCELRDSPLVTLELDAVTGRMSLVTPEDDADADDVDASLDDVFVDDEDVRPLTEGTGRRGLRSGGRNAILDGRFRESTHYFRRTTKEGDGRNHGGDWDDSNAPAVVPSRSPDSESIAEEKMKRTTTYLARSCPCDDSGLTYCIVDNIGSENVDYYFSSGFAVPSHCGVPRSSSITIANHNSNQTLDAPAYDFSRIGCFQRTPQNALARNAWPVMVLWYAALSLFLCATSSGKFARGYIVHRLFPKLGTNERRAEDALRREEGVRRRQMRVRAAAMARAAAEGQGDDYGGGVLGGETAVGPRSQTRPVRARGIRILDATMANTGGSHPFPLPDAYPRRRTHVLGMTEEEERREATRWWIRQAEQLGILSGSGETIAEEGGATTTTTTTVRRSPPFRRRRTEYVLRTRTFCAKKERARREELRRTRRSVEKRRSECTPSSSVSSPSKRAVERDEEGILTPNTSALSLDDDHDDGSEPSPCADTSEMENETLSSEPRSVSPPHHACSEEEEGEDASFECSICLAEIEDGERVGILPCAHSFHADCLSSWITRRNACPLCRGAEIATARSIEEEEEEGPPETADVNDTEEDEEAGGGARNDGPSEEEERGHGRDGTAEDRGPSSSPSWFPVAFLFPASPESTRSGITTPASSPRRLQLTTTSSSSGGGGDGNSPQNERRRRQRRRRREQRRSDDLW